MPRDSPRRSEQHRTRFQAAPIDAALLKLRPPLGKQAEFDPSTEMLQRLPSPSYHGRPFPEHRLRRHTNSCTSKSTGKPLTLIDELFTEKVQRNTLPMSRLSRAHHPNACKLQPLGSAAGSTTSEWSNMSLTSESLVCGNAHLARLRLFDEFMPFENLSCLAMQARAEARPTTQRSCRARRCGRPVNFARNSGKNVRCHATFDGLARVRTN